jgi:heme A synthase
MTAEDLYIQYGNALWQWFINEPLLVGLCLVGMGFLVALAALVAFVEIVAKVRAPRETAAKLDEDSHE